ncbi:hypothetical protein CVT25_004902, partial [Psilocybe cyanescens]
NSAGIDIVTTKTTNVVTVPNIDKITVPKYHSFLLDDGDWSAQGRYKVLSELDDAFTWQKDDNNNHVTHVLAYHSFLLDDGDWSAQGRYKVLSELDDAFTWQKDDNNNHVTHVLATSFEDSDLYLTPVLPSLSALKSGHRSVSTSSRHDTQSSVSVPVALTSHNSSEDA